MNKIVLLLLVGVIYICFVSNAQTYYPITHLTGTQNINGNNVTVTPAGGASTYANWCGIGPYLIGTGSASGSYTFTFSALVANIRIRLTAINSNEVISFSINGASYTLTAANLSPYAGTCNQPQAVIAGGNLSATLGTPTNPGAGTEVNIASSTSSIEIHANGVQNGTVFSISFRGISVNSNAPICQKDTLKLFILSDDIPGATYSWKGPEGYSSTLKNPTIPVATMAHEGMYVATIVTPNGTLTDSTYVTIMPTPITEIVYDEPVCAGKDLEFSNTTTLPGVSYQWQGPNNFSAAIPNPVIPNAQLFHSGIYTLTTTLGACSYVAAANINVLQPAQYSATEVICANEYFDFNGRRLDEPGTYRDTLIAANGCDSTITLNLVVLPAPEVNMYIARETSPFCIGDTVLCEATGAQSYLWYHNEKLVGNTSREYISLPDFSNKIIVVGALENSCHDTAEVAISLNTCCELFVPNAFSPNGDGINDGFASIPHGNIRDYRIEVFNRWGQTVFSSYDVNKQWDGVYNGVPADAGVYFYYLSARCLEGTKLIRKGELTLIR